MAKGFKHRVPPCNQHKAPMQDRLTSEIEKARLSGGVPLGAGAGTQEIPVRALLCHGVQLIFIKTKPWVLFKCEDQSSRRETPFIINFENAKQICAGLTQLVEKEPEILKEQQEKADGKEEEKNDGPPTKGGEQKDQAEPATAEDDSSEEDDVRNEETPATTMPDDRSGA